MGRDHRLINYAPISDTFVAFHTAIIYQDASYILLTYTPTIAEDAKHRSSVAPH